ncbi:MAG: hypothetical protein ACRDLF_16500, partial [Solirubrobacteraceae bacterium]
MTASTERRAGAPTGSFDVTWRAEREREQEQALPPGRVAVSCAARPGTGGLGRHLQEILDALARRGSRGVCVCDSTGSQEVCVCEPTGLQGVRVREPAGPTGASPRGRSHGRALTTVLGPAVRSSPAWRAWVESVAFDADAARRLPAADHLIAFNGQAVAQL